MFVNKEVNSFPGRVFYRAGGGITLGPFLAWLLVALVAAALLALLLLGLFLMGWYLLIIVPTIAALAVGALVRLAVTKGHCRNWIAAGLAGFCAAVVLYFGYFFWGMVYHWGPRAGAHPSLLPIYIEARMRTDVVGDVGRPRQSGTHDTKWNWFTLVFEAGMVSFVAVFPGIQRTRRPYCETCGRWMVRQVTSFNPSASPAVLEALRNGSSQVLAELGATPVYASVPNLTIGIDACPSLEEGGTRGCPVYISVKHVIQSQDIARVDPIDQARGKLFVRTLQASSNEVVSLAPRFKLLQSAVGRSVAAGPVLATTSNFVPGGLPVEIEPVEPEHAGKALSRGMLWGGALLTILPLVVLFGGLGAAAWAATLLEGATSQLEKLAAFGMIATGVISAAAGAIVGLRNPNYIANTLLEKRLRRQLALRPTRRVDPNNPGALFVEIVPKANWGRPMLDNASDVGLLLLDASKRELLFEGDRERFRIPADAITYCGLEEFVHQQGHSKVRFYFVVFRIESPTQCWEAPMRLRTGAGLAGRKRKKEMSLLFNRVQEMRLGHKTAGAII